MSVQGKGFLNEQPLTFDLPDGWKLLTMAEPSSVPAAEDVSATVKDAINNPIGMKKLDDFFPL